uniref:Putative secreted protein n=1 Tax=Panstrongylus lignarius TaxID=156445 RepID=A0A224XSB9_9HEMI
MFNIIIFLGVALIAAISLANTDQKPKDNKKCFQKCDKGREYYCSEENKYGCKQPSKSDYIDCIKHCSEEDVSHNNTKEIRKLPKSSLENSSNNTETSFRENKTTYGHRNDETPTGSYQRVYRTLKDTNTTTSDVTKVTLETSNTPVNEYYTKKHNIKLDNFGPEQVSAAVKQDAENFFPDNFRTDFDKDFSDFKPIEEIQVKQTRGKSKAEKRGEETTFF